MSSSRAPATVIPCVSPRTCPTKTKTHFSQQEALRCAQAATRGTTSPFPALAAAAARPEEDRPDFLADLIESGELTGEAAKTAVKDCRNPEQLVRVLGWCTDAEALKAAARNPHLPGSAVALLPELWARLDTLDRHGLNESPDAILGTLIAHSRASDEQVGQAVCEMIALSENVRQDRTYRIGSLRTHHVARMLSKVRKRSRMLAVAEAIDVAQRRRGSDRPVEPAVLVAGSGAVTFDDALDWAKHAPLAEKRPGDPTPRYVSEIKLCQRKDLPPELVKDIVGGVPCAVSPWGAAAAPSATAASKSSGLTADALVELFEGVKNGYTANNLAKHPNMPHETLHRVLLEWPPGSVQHRAACRSKYALRLIPVEDLPKARLNANALSKRLQAHWGFSDSERGAMRHLMSTYPEPWKLDKNSDEVQFARMIFA